MSNKKIIQEYLMESVNFDDIESYINTLHELVESYDSVPDEVLDAYTELSENDKWDVIQKVAAHGKKVGL